jgi:hypothetical protein
MSYLLKQTKRAKYSIPRDLRSQSQLLHLFPLLQLEGNYPSLENYLPVKGTYYKLLV